MQKYSQLFGKTNKSAKAFESINATLLQKGGFIHQEMAGVYSFLPLGLRVLTKIENIIRQEINTIGQEMLMTALAPKELCEQTGRLDTVDVLMKTSGANEISRNKSTNEYVLNCTHEDMVTAISKKYSLSYKEFPFALYQIQSKFRNEARAKSGLLRGREFRMKDLYSFHTSPEDLQMYYENAKSVYKRIYERLGLGADTVMALASGGDFTKDYSHEFQTRCDAGEDVIFYDKKLDIAYNKEVAPSKAQQFIQENTTAESMQEVEGVGIIGVEKLAKFLNIPVELTTKTILFETETGAVIAAVIRGDYEINEDKLKKVINASKINLASAETVKRVTNAEVGYAGPLGLASEVTIVWDDSTADRVNFECGANKTNYHTININFDRDISRPEQFYDFKLVKEGDLHPETNQPFEVFKACEVGNIFPLNTKFSKALDYTFVDAEGKQQPVYMGSYGIGPSRIMGVIVEKFHDENGIIWPQSVAPYDIHLITIGDQHEQQALEIIKSFEDSGKEVLWDDRKNVNPGAKFGDADLIGLPVRIVLSDRSLQQGGVEVKYRNEEESGIVPIAELANLVVNS